MSRIGRAPVEDAGDVRLLAVHAPARTAHPPQACDRTPPVGGVLEPHDELLLGARAVLRVALDVALLDEDAGDLGLHLRVRHLHDIVLSHLRVADPGKEIRYRIVYRHTPTNSLS